MWLPKFPASQNIVCWQASGYCAEIGEDLAEQGVIFLLFFCWDGCGWLYICLIDQTLGISYRGAASAPTNSHI